MRVLESKPWTWSLTLSHRCRTYCCSRDACSLSSDGRRLLDILEAFCSTGCPHQRLSRAVCQLDVCAGTGWTVYRFTHLQLMGTNLYSHTVTLIKRYMITVAGLPAANDYSKMLWSCLLYFQQLLVVQESFPTNHYPLNSAPSAFHKIINNHLQNEMLISFLITCSCLHLKW